MPLLLSWNYFSCPCPSRIYQRTNPRSGCLLLFTKGKAKRDREGDACALRELRVEFSRKALGRNILSKIHRVAVYSLNLTTSLLAWFWWHVSTRNSSMKISCPPNPRHQNKRTLVLYLTILYVVLPTNRPVTVSVKYYSCIECLLFKRKSKKKKDLLSQSFYLLFFN